VNYVKGVQSNNVIATIKHFACNDQEWERNYYDVQAVAAVNPNIIVVVYGGVPVSMKHWLQKVKAVLLAGYPGQEGGTALAQILFGEVNPSSKLPYSCIQSQNVSPGFKNYRNPDLKVPYSEGVFVGYKYYEKNNIKPLFPFGYGLSYTTFAYSDIQVAKKGKREFVVSATIQNTGTREGEEVVQLYLGQKNCKVERPLKELRGFGKIGLKPGEKKTVEFKLDEKSFRYWHPEKNNWVVDSDNFDIFIGASSADIKLKTTIKL